MTSGQKSIVINRAERAVSPDINRLQALQTRGAMERLRWQYSVFQGFDDDGAASSATEYLTATAPMGGDVLGGLCVIPQVGALGLGVTDGIVMLVDPDATPSADDSPYKMVEDAGGLPVCTSTSGGGALAMTPNASGDIRIDVIECTRVQDPNPEEDNRDVFNPTTGLFTATSVTKTTASALQYRVRLGTPGAGYPGSVDEWLPLAVASVPPSTTTNDTITFWDVRPLVNDRTNGPANTAQLLPRRTKLVHASQFGSGAEYLVNGIAEATLLGPGPSGGRRLGGTIRRGSPGADDLYSTPCVDFGDTANQEQGFSNPGSGLGYFYLCRMFGLPRWARYTDYTAGQRVPRGPRGIPLLSLTGPVPVFGTPISALEPPAVFGFNGATTFDAVCWGATVLFTATGPHVAAETTADGWTTPSIVAVATGSWNSGTSTGTVDVTENTHFPAGATRVRLRLSVELTMTTGGPQQNLQFGFPSGLQLEVLDSPVTTAVTQLAAPPIDINTNQSLTAALFLVWDIDATLPTAYPQFTNTPLAYKLSFVLTTIGFSLPSQATFSNVTCEVLAFKYE